MTWKPAFANFKEPYPSALPISRTLLPFCKFSSKKGTTFILLPFSHILRLRLLQDSACLSHFISASSFQSNALIRFNPFEKDLLHEHKKYKCPDTEVHNTPWMHCYQFSPIRKNFGLH